MRIARGKQCAAIEYRQVQRGARTKFAHIHVAAERAGRAGAKFAVFARSHAHDAAERAQRYRRGVKRAGDAALEDPMEKMRLREAILQESEARDHAGPAPPLMRHFQDVDLQYIAGLGALNEDRSGQRVDFAAIDSLVVGNR